MKTYDWIQVVRLVIVRAWAPVAALVILAASVSSAAGPAQDTVEVWVRSPGGQEAAGPPRRQVDLGKLKGRVGERRDPQYGRSYTFRSVPIGAVIEQVAVPPSADLALLHFANGMTIPLPWRDRQVMARLDPWVARSVILAGKARPLPSVTRSLPEYVDNRGIEFSGNKLVVADDWHPALAPGAQASFSPWRHSDTLVGIELVNAQAYYRQLDVDADPEARAGLELYKQSCQFCHGTRNVGPKYGWDFVDPVPLYRYRASGKTLFWHINYKRYDAAEHGERMPALKHMTEEDAARLWIWLKAVGTRPLAPYAPTRIASR